TPATAVFPDAVGPKSASNVLGARGLFEAMRELIRSLRAFERPVLVGMRRTPLLEPRDRLRYAFVQRRRRRPAKHVVRLADIRDVVRDFPEEGWSDCHVRFDAELFGDQLGCTDERVALAVGEVDRLVARTTFSERVRSACDPVDTVIDVREVEDLLVAAEDRDRFAARQLMHPEWEHPVH